jgi:hypothetical protein
MKADFAVFSLAGTFKMLCINLLITILTKIAYAYILSYSF